MFKEPRKPKILSKYFLSAFAITLTILVALTIIIDFHSIQEEFKNISSSFIQSAIAVLTVGISAVGLGQFLYRGKAIEYERRYTSTVKQELFAKEKIQSLINDVITNQPEVKNVEKAVYEKIVRNLEQSLIGKLEDRFRKNIENDLAFNQIKKELQPLTFNTERYIDRITRNSIVNLMIGILATLASIIFLVTSLNRTTTFLNFQDFFIYFFPRVTFAIFIQLFAFFFLRLYKNNLEDAKYFENELTNLNAKTSSLKIALFTNNIDTFQKILLDLSQIERNFKLSKQETMLSLEKGKIESEFDKGILDQLKELLSKYNVK